MTSSEGPRYRAVYPELVKQKLWQLSETARQRRLSTEFLSVLRAIDHRLQSDPGNFGEVIYHLKNAQLEVRHGVYGFLSVHFAVDAIRLLVYVHQVEMMSGRES
jgi:hypothetical protein